MRFFSSISVAKLLPLISLQIYHEISSLLLDEVDMIDVFEYLKRSHKVRMVQALQHFDFRLDSTAHLKV